MSESTLWRPWDRFGLRTLAGWLVVVVFAARGSHKSRGGWTGMAQHSICDLLISVMKVS